MKRRPAAEAAEELVFSRGLEPVKIGGWAEVRLMEAPPHDGAVYGEAYRPDDARRIAEIPLPTSIAPPRSRPSCDSGLMAPFTGVGDALTEALFARTPQIRYVSHARGQEVGPSSR